MTRIHDQLETAYSRREVVELTVRAEVTYFGEDNGLQLSICSYGDNGSVPILVDAVTGVRLTGERAR